MIVGFSHIFLFLGILLAMTGIIFALPMTGNISGDVSYTTGNMSLYYPLATSMVLSLILTIALNVMAGMTSRR